LLNPNIPTVLTRCSLPPRETSVIEKAHQMNCSVKPYCPKITLETYLITLAALSQ